MASLDLFNENRLPRGIYNNNPLNIKFVPRNRWKGLSGHDEEFCIFSSAEYGVRAAIIILSKYIKRQSDISVREVISTWAPDGYIVVSNYVRSALAYVNSPLNPSYSPSHFYFPWSPFRDIFHCYYELAYFIKGMIEFENAGQCPYSIDEIDNWCYKYAN